MHAEFIIFLMSAEPWLHFPAVSNIIRASSNNKYRGHLDPEIHNLTWHFHSCCPGTLKPTAEPLITFRNEAKKLTKSSRWQHCIGLVQSQSYRVHMTHSFFFLLVHFERTNIVTTAGEKSFLFKSCTKCKSAFSDSNIFPVHWIENAAYFVNVVKSCAAEGVKTKPREAASCSTQLS